MATYGNEFAKAVCEALGIDPGVISAVGIDAKAHEMLTVTLSVIPTAEAGMKMAEAARKLIDEKKIVNINLTRPVMERTSLISQAREYVSE